MLNKIEAFFFGKVAGRVIARLAVAGAAWAAGQAAAHGVNVDPNELSAALIAGANAAYTAISEWRAKRALAATVAVESK
jgi:hypothetical protein